MKKLLVVIAMCDVMYCAAQNVGIGITTPAFKLDVRTGSINTDSLYRINSMPVLSIKGTNNVFAGDRAGNSNVSGTDNTFMGFVAGFANATGIHNTFIGSLSGSQNLSGDNNTAVGSNSMNSNNDGDFNTAVGRLALQMNVSGSFNTAIGGQALLRNTGSSNTAVGLATLGENTTGSSNTGVGQSALFWNNGSNNTATGVASLLNNSSGGFNTAVGTSSLVVNTTGSFNTGLGYNATLGGPGLTNATAIGANALVTTNNSIVLGSIAGVNTATNSTRVGIGVTNPTTTLHVSSPSGPVALFDGPAGMYMMINETGVYRGYIGSYAGNAEDVDFGTGSGNSTGRLHFTIQADPKLTITAAGNIEIENELHRPLKTGAANLVPIAYGNISSAGFVQAGTGNFTVMHSAGSGFYEIAINGEDYQFQQYITVVTPIGSSAPVIATTGSGADRLQVFLYTITGADIDANFHFVVYKQ